MKNGVAELSLSLLPYFYTSRVDTFPLIALVPPVLSYLCTL